MKNTIKFLPTTQQTGINGILPIPAIKALPQWFIQKSRYMGEAKKFAFDSGKINLTVKACNPFLDALSAGYMILLENDIQVIKNEFSDPNISWSRGGSDFISLHKYDQISSQQIPTEYVPVAYKFASSWGVQLPKNYSALFVHPLNRTDLPFHTFSGVVECDRYHMAINFPFIIKKDFEGIIEAGTPIAQIIPIKRDSWVKKIMSFDSAKVEKELAKFSTKLYGFYKANFWSRKNYT